MSNILSPQLEILRLPLQKTLKGGVQLSNSGNLKVLDLPKLTTAYGQVNLQNSKLVNLNLPALTSIQGNTYITNNLKLEKVNLPKLKSMSLKIKGTSSRKQFEKCLRQIERLHKQDSYIKTGTLSTAAGFLLGTAGTWMSMQSVSRREL